MEMNKKRVGHFAARAVQQGFSMIEVLVTMLFISVALLGTAGLQAYAMKVSQGGQFRTQAVFLAADLAERMEANLRGAVAGNYVLANGSAPGALSTACYTVACSPADLATYDLSQWRNAIAAVLPQSSWTVAQTTTGNPSVYTITISWVDRRTDTSYESAGTGENFFYTATRTIAN